MDGIKAITLGDIAVILAFIAGIIGSITVIYKVVATFAKKRREQLLGQVETAVQAAVKPLEDRVGALDADIKSLKAGLHENNLETARIDLCQAIKHTPTQHRAIVKLAERYFLELGGDTWMSGLFKQWGKEQGVDTSIIFAQVHGRENHNN